MRMRLTLKLLIPVLLVLRYFADSASVVKLLPGFEGPLPFELETGYIGLGEEEEIQMFYYFIKSENNPQEDPLLIWLTGGPGCSSIFGLLFENGPLALKFEVYNGSIPSLVSTTYSWTKPVGSGFSYSRTPLVDKISDTGEVKRIHEFLQKWLSKHPKFYANPFYVAGDSYSGMVVPPVVQEISEGNYICCKPLINLQGYILGNPVTDTKLEHNYLIPFAYGMALISEELYESMKRICKGSYGNVDSLNTECLKLTEIYQKCTDRLNKYHILLPDCDKTSPDCHVSNTYFVHLVSLEEVFDLIGFICLSKNQNFGKKKIITRLLLQLYKYFLLEKWANNERVHKALHVNKGSIGEWRQCNYDGISYKYDIQSSVPYHKNNSINGFRSLIFSGDHDMTVPFLATQAWIRSLNYSIIDDWRPWMMNDQIAGYTRTYANKMTFATVKASLLAST
ncbi:hypothetical protein DY000_02033660 [Brassica cretica]|uniref:Sinapoylglucose:choline sinapoyltransferase n=1 Tax=Brassica cretica TaxID=69181 RepID=A0ABQ7DJF8_BRACR|nr:hypothetical protein DY000_02033660 [Brassica cretica]